MTHTRHHPSKMSQLQPQRPQPEHPQTEPIKYGDVFPVSGELANEPISPEDAAMMQSGENLVLGKTQKGGPASVMQSAGTRNERAGVVGHTDVSDIPGDQGVTVAEAIVQGRRIVVESIGGQVVTRYVEPAPVAITLHAPAALEKEAFTIGDALEASAITAGHKPVEQSDAAAIQAAEMRATGRNVIEPGGVAATAQSAATANTRILFDEDKTTLGDVLTDAATKLPTDKVVTAQDAEGVVGAELRNNPNMMTYPGGVADSVAKAATINQMK